MYTQLEIKNFRCFKNFEMKLKPITLISGMNNTGKTSVLDSVFLFHNYAYPDVFLELLRSRGTRQGKGDTLAKNAWEPLFYNMDVEKPVEIRLNGQHLLRLAKNNEYALSNHLPGIFDGKIDFTSSNYALSCCYEKGDEHFDGDYLRCNEKLDNNLVLQGRNNAEFIKNEGECQCFGPNSKLDDLTVAELFGKVETSMNKTDMDRLMRVLSILDGCIEDITTIAAYERVQLYFTGKQGVKLPIHIMGDGIRKLLYIALVLLTKPGCILLLDEVENGLHYSLHAKFWELISIMAMQEKCQIIATTHSYECINGALEGVEAANLHDSFSYTRLDRSADSIVPKTFTSDMLERALDLDWEVR